MPLREQVQLWKATQEIASGPNSTVPSAEPGAERSKAANRNIQVRLRLGTAGVLACSSNRLLRQHLYILGLGQ